MVACAAYDDAATCQAAQPEETRVTPDPDTYARGHALFEARSDQRSRIVSWLGDRLARTGRRRPPVGPLGRLR